jgi:hypothetical protein
MWPAGPTFESAPPIIAFDLALQRLEEADPDGFATEYQSQWRTHQDAYLRPEHIAAMFGPWRGEPLEPQHQGTLANRYIMHADPSKSGANFAVATAHSEIFEGQVHVVFDHLHAWDPATFPDHQIDYLEIESELKDLLDRFLPFQFSVDQFSSAPIMGHLRAHLNGAGRAKLTTVVERTATARRNFEMAETFKTALGMGLIHAPAHHLARLELEYLQEREGKVHAPTSGEVRTDDLADAMFNVVFELLGTKADLLEALSQLQPQGALPGGIACSPRDQLIIDSFSRCGPQRQVGAPRGDFRDPSRGRRC